MRVLALDTTGAHCSVAIVGDGEVLANLSERIGRGHAERLAPMVVEALTEAGLAPSDIDRVAVCTGPGSFTGQRVGLSLAKGFALPRNLPVIGLSAPRIAAEGTVGDVVVRIDVRRGQVGWASYRDGLETRPFRVEDAAAADAAIAGLAPAHILSDPVPDMPSAARIAAVADPDAFPADPLYSRGPDAKLPGGLLPP